MEVLIAMTTGVRGGVVSVAKAQGPKAGAALMSVKCVNNRQTVKMQSKSQQPKMGRTLRAFSLRA